MGTDAPERAEDTAGDWSNCSCHRDAVDEPTEQDFRIVHQRLVKTTRSFRMAASCTQAMLSAGDEMSLLQKLCRIIVKTGGYTLAWVGYAEFDDAKTVRPVAYAGAGENYVRDIRISWGDNDYGRGPTGLAVRSGESYVARYIEDDPEFAPWRERAKRFGYASSIAIPLYCEGAVLGALNIYSGEADSFDVEEVALLERLARHIAFGIDIRTRSGISNSS